MMLSLIYARAENRCIGVGGKLPWRLPDEFAHFKRTTMGRPIIMGRRTFEDHRSVLPGRTNIVLTRRHEFSFDGLVIARDLDEALRPYRDSDGEVFVIGGAGLFAEAFPHARRVYETVVHATIDGDTFLPEFDFTGWSATVLERHPADARHAHAFTITRYDAPAA
jgi:dihydrofolate reductase